VPAVPTPAAGGPGVSGYVELHCHSAFSLLDGASSPEALVARARELGHPALALTDHDDLGGAVRFAEAARAVGIAGIIGAEVTVARHEARGERDEGERPPSAPPRASALVPRASHLVLLAESREGYGNLATLLTRARTEAPRGEPCVSLDRLAAHAGGLFALTGCPRGWVPSLAAAGDLAGARRAAGTLAEIFGGRLAVECWDHALPEERAVVRELVPLAGALGLPWVVTNDVHYARPAGRVVHDVLSCLRHGRPLDAMGTRLRPNAEWCLKSARQLRRRWRHDEAGLRASVAIAERCAFRLDQLRPSLPAFPLPPGVTDDEYLERLVEQGAHERWGAVGERQRRQREHELAIIRRLGLAGYFLIVWDIVRYARREGILCQGRGSAANSAVCYCLGITAVDPVRMGLLFERFLSEERQEAPDIDLDFAHRERERVIQYVYERYGREHAAMVCEQITYRGRSAVRDAARVLGFSVEQAEALSALSDRFSARATAEALRQETGGAEEAGAAPNVLTAHGPLHPMGTAPAVEAHARRDADRRALAAGTVGAGAAGARAPEGGERVTTAAAAGGNVVVGGGPPRPARDVSPSGHVARAVASSLVRGTEATTRANAEKAAARRAAFEPSGSPSAQSSGSTRQPWVDPHAADDHTERRNPTTALRAAAPDAGDSILARAGLDPADRRVRALAEVVDGLHQVPRHRSIHVGGFVLTREPLSSVVPIEPASMPGRTVIQWEKDDLDPVGLVKIDLLGLGMLTVLQDCLKYVRQTRGVTLDLGQLEMTDQAVYDDLCAADTIGVFQVESRAQQNTLPRLKPRSFYDLVVEVALIRPGPIQGDMVHPYLRRRAGLEPVTYPHPSLEPILRRTLGVPLFQEQGMQVAIACAGFTPGEADNLRRAMGHKRSRERMAEICDRLVSGMRANGIAEETALRIYNQINAFADYGFPESHAASFALLVYASAYLKHYYAPEFTAALLNAQPMGFYAPGTIIEDARRHGVRVLPVDLTRSAWDATLERGTAGEGRGTRGPLPRRPSPRASDLVPPPSVRLGLRSVRGLGARARERLEGALREGAFVDVADVVRRAGLDRRALRYLAEGGAFDGMFGDVPRAERRRHALWAVLAAVREDAGPLAPAAPASRPAPLPAMAPFELTEADYRITGISLNGHPMRHLRAALAPNGLRTARDLLTRGRDGERVGTAGLVICRQRPGTARGFVFLSLEDETGIINVVVTPRLFERDALMVSTTPLLLVRGTLQVEERVVNVRAHAFRALEAPVGAEHARRHDFH